MSQTSHLADHPFGAAVSLTPPGERRRRRGWPIPLVGQSERDRGLVPAMDRLPAEFVGSLDDRSRERSNADADSEDGGCEMAPANARRMSCVNG